MSTIQAEIEARLAALGAASADVEERFVRGSGPVVMTLTRQPARPGAEPKPRAMMCAGCASMKRSVARRGE